MKASLAILIFFGLLAGCAPQVPVPTAFQKSYQPKVWAAQHWNVLAANMAARLKASVADLQPQNQPFVVYVKRPHPPTVFSETFYQLLKTQLMQQGFGLATAPRRADLEADINIDYAGLASKDISTAYTKITKNDKSMAVTVSLLHGDRYLTRVSDVFYIDHSISDEYLGGPSVPPTRLVKLVGPKEPTQ